MSIEDPQGGDRWRNPNGSFRKTHELDITDTEREELLKVGQRKQIEHAESKPQIYVDFPWMQGKKAEPRAGRDKEDDAQWPIDR